MVLNSNGYPAAPTMNALSNNGFSATAPVETPFRVVRRESPTKRAWRTPVLRSLAPKPRLFFWRSHHVLVQRQRCIVMFHRHGSLNSKRSPVPAFTVKNTSHDVNSFIETLYSW